MVCSGLWRYSALAGGFVLENIIDERVDDASTFEFNITGSIDDPKIIRLN